MTSGAAGSVLEGTHFHMPHREVIEALANSSNGDIRSAVNSLQVLCLRGNGHFIVQL